VGVPVPRFLNTCNNQLSGQLPTWIASMTSLTSARAVTLGECGVPVTACAAGYACDNNSLSIMANPCGTGQFSTAGAAVCSACPVGTYSNVTAAHICSLCSAGRFGDTTGLTTSACAGACPPGRYGGQGVINSTCDGPCDAGRWGVAGANSSACDGPCDAGRWGVAGETSPACSGECSAG
jgi:hypothetical protein